MLKNKFAIIDRDGLVKSEIETFNKAKKEYKKLKEDGHRFNGSVLIVKIYELIPDWH